MVSNVIKRGRGTAAGWLRAKAAKLRLRGALPACCAALVGAGLAGWPGTAAAQQAVTFDGSVVASCVLAVSTPGVLAANANGTEVGSEQTLGAAAVVSVTATAGTPSLTVGAPSLSSKPAAYAGTPSLSVKYTSTGGANQGYTSGSSNYTSNSATGDTITLHAKATDAAGFAAGAYQIQTTVTCSQ